MQLNKSIDLAVIGGGPAGFMGAIKAAEDGASSTVIYEATSKILEKVRISGGGRCNVINACWEPSVLVTNYPRGERPLLGAFSRFAAGDALNWFEARGLELISEEDGRIFPKSNSSLEVIKCLRDSANKAGVTYCTKMAVEEVKFSEKKDFLLKFRNQSVINAKKVLIASGGGHIGRKIASALGHQIVLPVPSLFAFKLYPTFLNSCAGISVDNVKLKLLCDSKSFKQEGRVLITHKGLSGPAILKMSAFAARNLYLNKYNASLMINWVGINNEEIKHQLRLFRDNHSEIKFKKNYPFPKLSKRLWLHFIGVAGISTEARWSSLSNFQENLLAKVLGQDSHLMKGRGPFGEEFVTAGGVSLKEINFKSMESRICSGLYFAGEILDIDGVTGGFNFQHCWTSGWIAGRAIARDLMVTPKM